MQAPISASASEEARGHINLKGCTRGTDPSCGAYYRGRMTSDFTTDDEVGAVNEMCIRNSEFNIRSTVELVIDFL